MRTRSHRVAAYNFCRFLQKIFSVVILSISFSDTQTPTPQLAEPIPLSFIEIGSSGVARGAPLAHWLDVDRGHGTTDHGRSGEQTCEPPSPCENKPMCQGARRYDENPWRPPRNILLCNDFTFPLSLPVHPPRHLPQTQESQQGEQTGESYLRSQSKKSHHVENSQQSIRSTRKTTRTLRFPVFSGQLCEVHRAIAELGKTSTLACRVLAENVFEITDSCVGNESLGVFSQECVLGNRCHVPVRRKMHGEIRSLQFQMDCPGHK